LGGSFRSAQCVPEDKSFLLTAQGIRKAGNLISRGPVVLLQDATIVLGVTFNLNRLQIRRGTNS
jgi:hypothetical protein